VSVIPLIRPTRFLIHQCAPQVCAVEARILQLRSVEPGVLQLRVGEVRALQLCLTEDCALQLRTEGRVALRTRRSLVPRIVERAKREHPYEVPSVVAVPIIDGGPDYIGWILEQTEQPA
jgi:hypothetical protein